jgi:16S rRNA U516 pseudouridylate synthase RsuA-like enzyme
MTAAVGLFTLRLIRVAFKSVTSDGLKVEEWRELTIDEAKALRVQSSGD